MVLGMKLFLITIRAAIPVYVLARKLLKRNGLQITYFDI